MFTHHDVKNSFSCEVTNWHENKLTCRRRSDLFEWKIIHTERGAGAGAGKLYVVVLAVVEFASHLDDVLVFTADVVREDQMSADLSAPATTKQLLTCYKLYDDVSCLRQTRRNKQTCNYIRNLETTS